MNASRKHLIFTGISLVVLGGCTGGSSLSTRRFPLQAPLWRDTDLDPVAMSCQPDPKPPKGKPNHQVCAPPEYVSSFALDGADNILLRPMVRFFAVDPAGEALNVNSMDEVADSTWFVNRIGRGNFTAADVTSGYCGNEVLDPNSGAGTWIIDQGKTNGANPGFRVNIPGLGKFMLKSDPPEQPERATGATSIASRIYYAAGWWAPCDAVVYFDPSVLKLKEGLKVTDNTGVSKPFDEAALKKLLAGASHRGPLVRMVASRWLPGRTVGPFTYAGVRKDDPADVIPHEHRRDLRGAKLFAAWTSHFDSREQNTMTTWMAANEKDPDSSPGYLRHWYIDLGDCFGSEWDWEGMSKRLSYSYYFDIPYILEDFLSLGIPERHWDHAKRSEDGAIFGFFESADFDPETWRGGYPNPTFANMTEHDAAWATRLIARFTPEDVLAAVKVGDYTDPRHTPFILHHLLVRQRRILERYFSKLSPMTDFKVEGTTLCGVDLARKTKTFPDAKFAYAGKLYAGEELAPRYHLLPAVADEGQVCFSLNHVAPDGGDKDNAASRYLFVDVTNGQAEAPVRIHFYDLGPTRGFRIVGLER
ncbi:MAG: hypothetical protein ABIP39_03185 [Polyangiaceae bacterium]